MGHGHRSRGSAMVCAVKKRSSQWEARSVWCSSVLSVSAGREDRVRPWSAPSKSAVFSGNSDQCSHIGARTASWIVPCGAASERFSRGCALTGIECPDGAPVALTRCHEFVDTTVTETRGDDVLDLRATRGSRGSVQSYSLLGMETPMVPY